MHCTSTLAPHLCKAVRQSHRLPMNCLGALRAIAWHHANQPPILKVPDSGSTEWGEVEEEPQEPTESRTKGRSRHHAWSEREPSGGDAPGPSGVYHSRRPLMVDSGVPHVRQAYRSLRERATFGVLLPESSAPQPHNFPRQHVAPLDHLPPPAPAFVCRGRAAQGRQPGKRFWGALDAFSDEGDRVSASSRTLAPQGRSEVPFQNNKYLTTQPHSKVLLPLESGGPATSPNNHRNPAEPAQPLHPPRPVALATKARPSPSKIAISAHTISLERYFPGYSKLTFDFLRTRQFDQASMWRMKKSKARRSESRESDSAGGQKSRQEQVPYSGLKGNFDTPKRETQDNEPQERAVGEAALEENSDTRAPLARPKKRKPSVGDGGRGARAEVQTGVGDPLVKSGGTDDSRGFRATGRVGRRHSQDLPHSPQLCRLPKPASVWGRCV